MISPTAEYALRAVVYLGSQPGTSHTSQQIAEVTRVPPAYLPKVLQSLGRAGLVRGQRGVHGGYMLARDLDELTLYDVIEAVDPRQRIEACPLGIVPPGAGLCSLHHHLGEVLRTAERMLTEVTIGQLVRRKPRSGACPGLVAKVAGAPAARRGGSPGPRR